MRPRLKVLVSAYACSPYQGSEPGVGWGFVHALAEHHDLHVIIEEEKFRSEVTRWLSEHPEEGRSISFHFVPKTRNRALRRLWPPSYYHYYRQWHQHAFDLAKRLHARENFDLAHQLTMVGFREPGYLWKLGIPFVWGPVGGMGFFPWRFMSALRLRDAAYYLGYNAFNLVQMRYSRRPRLAAAATHGEGLLVATSENRVGAARYWRTNGRILAEVGIPQPPVKNPVSRRDDEALRLVWSGAHLPRKALQLALGALARLPRHVAWHLSVLGHGPMSEHWKLLADRLGLSGQITFHGKRPRNEALAEMAGSHVAVVTSLRDLTSTVTVEALTLGLPVLCPNHCGFSDVIDDSCGIRLTVNSPTGFMVDLANAIIRLESDEAFRQSLAQGAIRRAHEFDWSRKGEFLDRIYRKAALTRDNFAEDDVE